MSPVTDLAQLRVDYKRAALSEHDVAANPFDQFARWFDEAVAAAIPEPNAMTLATVDATGRPSARIVLLKAVDARGFEAIRRLRAIRDEVQWPTLAEFKRMVHDQAFILLLDQEAAVAALPALINDPKSRRGTVAVVRRVLSAGGDITGEVAERLQRIARVLGVEDVASASAAA